MTDTPVFTLVEDTPVPETNGEAQVTPMFSEVPAEPPTTSVDARTAEQKVVDYARDVKEAEIKSGERDLVVGDLESLDYLSYDKIYERASQPDAVGKWLSDAIARRSDDPALLAKISERRGAYEGGLVFEEGRAVPKGYESVQIHDSAWKSATRAAIAGATMQWGDELYAMVNAKDDAEYEEIVRRHEEKLAQFRGSNPVLSFMSEGAGIVGTSVLAAPLATVARGGAAAATAARVGAGARVAGAVADVGKLAALGAAENVVYGAGERVDDKFVLDAVIEDGVEGALFGAGIGATFKIAPKVVDTARQVVNGLTGKAIGASTDNVASAMDNALKTAGIPKADIVKLHMESLAKGENLSVIEAVTLSADDPVKVDRFLELVTDYVTRTGDLTAVDTLRSNISDLATITAGKAAETATRIADGNMDDALIELSRRVQSGVATADNIDAQVKELVELLPEANRVEFMSLLRADPALVNDAKRLEKAVSSIDTRRKQVGKALDNASRRIRLNNTLDEIDATLDDFRAQRPDGMPAPREIIPIKTLQKRINDLPVFSERKGLWEMKIAPQFGGRSKIVARMLSGDAPVQEFVAKMSQVPSLAKKYGVSVDRATGAIKAPSVIEFDAKDFKRLKDIDGFEELLRQKSGLRGDVSVAPPDFTGRNMREAVEQMRAKFVEKRSNIKAEASTAALNEIDIVLKDRSQDYRRHSENYRRWKRATEYAGADEASGAMKPLIDYIENPAPTAGQQRDLSDIPPQAIPTILAKYLTGDDFIKLFDKGGEQVVRRLGEVRKVADQNFDVDKLVADMKSIRKGSESIESLRDKVLDAFDSGGLRAATKDVSAIPNAVAKLGMTGENVGAEIARVRAGWNDARSTFDQFKTTVENSGLNTGDVQAALSSLEQTVSESAVRFDQLIGDVYESTMLKAVNGVTKENLEETVKPISNMLRSKEGREIFKTAMERRLGRNIVDATELSRLVDDELKTLDNMVDLASMVRKLKESTDLGLADVRSASIFMDAFTKTGRTKSSSIVNGRSDGIVYFLGELLRLFGKSASLNHPNLNKREIEIMTEALSKNPSNSAVVKRAMDKFIGQKPADKSWVEWLISKEAQRAILQFAVVADA